MPKKQLKGDKESIQKVVNNRGGAARMPPEAANNIVDEDLLGAVGGLITITDENKREYNDRVSKNVSSNIKNWLTSKGMTATLSRNRQSKKMKEEIAATKSNDKAQKYLGKNLKTYLDELFIRYVETNRTFYNQKDLEDQLSQDIKLRILKLDDMVGIPHNYGQFSSEDKSGGNKPLRIFRTTESEDWEMYQANNDIKKLLRGHGGSFGQALDYFYKSRNPPASKEIPDNTMIMFDFSNDDEDRSASRLIDYNEIIGGAEGEGPKGDRLTGKSEQNDILGESKVFSIHLGKSQDFISGKNPAVFRIAKAREDNP
ncbi:MAG: hypothetical protein GKR88_10965 [Flavobacteriaceae bacterium]|nr:MAG: hypothetical protein GKR88_10965 [Flavobacteriaceae bacterium]